MSDGRSGYGIEKYRLLHLKPVRLQIEIKLATKVCGPHVLRTCQREIFMCVCVGGGGYWKGEVYEVNPHSLDELKKKIRTTYWDYWSHFFFCKVYLYVITRTKKCTDSQRSHFQHLWQCAFSLSENKRKQNFFVISPCKGAGFKWEHSVDGKELSSGKVLWKHLLGVTEEFIDKPRCNRFTTQWPPSCEAEVWNASYFDMEWYSGNNTDGGQFGDRFNPLKWMADCFI